MSEKISPLAQELLSRADSIFAKIAEAASKAGDFAAEQLPDIAYQFVAYNRAYYTSLIVIQILAVVVSIWVIKRWFKDFEGAVLVPTMLVIVCSFLLFCSTLKPFLMVWFAPKIFIITEIVNLVK